MNPLDPSSWTMPETVFNPRNPDDLLRVAFSYRTQDMPHQSSIEGKPVTRTYEHIDIYIPGKADAHVSREVTEEDKKRFAARYNAWKNNATKPPDGIPLREWPGMTQSMISECERHNIFTVEQLSGMAEVDMPRLGLNAKELVRRAKDYLEQCKGLQPLSRLRVEHEDLKKQHEALKDNFEFVKQKLVSMEMAFKALARGGDIDDFEPLPAAEVAEVRKRGRPKKEKGLDLI